MIPLPPKVLVGVTSLTSLLEAHVAFTEVLRRDLLTIDEVWTGINPSGEVDVCATESRALTREEEFKESFIGFKSKINKIIITTINFNFMSNFIFSHKICMFRKLSIFLHEKALIFVEFCLILAVVSLSSQVRLLIEVRNTVYLVALSFSERSQNVLWK